MKEKVKDNVLEPKIILDQSFFKPKMDEIFFTIFHKKSYQLLFFCMNTKKRGRGLNIFRNTYCWTTFFNTFLTRLSDCTFFGTKMIETHFFWSIWFVSQNISSTKSSYQNNGGTIKILIIRGVRYFWVYIFLEIEKQMDETIILYPVYTYLSQIGRKNV